MMIKLTEKKIQLVLVLLVFLVYGNTIGHQFAWDDSIVITENPRVKKGISGIPDLFVKYNSDYKADKYGYRPIVLTSFAIEYSLFRDNPNPWHFMNVLYFSLLCLVLFKVLRQLFYKFTNLAPFLITVLFLVHPLHVEVTANVKSRDEIFALLFSLLSLNYLIHYYHSSKIKELSFSFLFFLLAFLSKESAIVFLFILPLTLLYFGEKLNSKKMLMTFLFIFVLLGISITIYAMYTTTSLGKNFSEGAGIYYENGILGNSFFHTYRFDQKLANAFTVLLLYLKNFFYPVTQIYYYGYNQIPVGSFKQVGVIVSVLIHLGLLLFVIFKFKKYREICFGILFYFISISIYTHLFRTLSDTMADRFMFAPSLGLCVSAIFLLGTFLKINFQTTNLELFLNGKPVKYLFLLVFMLLGIKTYTRNRVWKDNWTLISSDQPKLENCSRAHNFYADELKKRLYKSFDPVMEMEMISHYKSSILISNEAYYAYLGLGTYLCEKNKFGEGIAVLDSMVRLFPEKADPNFYLGRALLETKNYSNAIFHLKKSLILAPAVLETYHVLSLAYSKNGEYENALAVIEQARKRFSESLIIYDALGNIYFDSGDLEKSTKYTLEMLKYGEDPKRVYGTIIGRYQFKKQDSLASKYYKEAVSMGVFKRGSNQ